MKSQEIDVKKEQLERSLRSLLTLFHHKLHAARQKIEMVRPEKKMNDVRAKLLLLQGLLQTAVQRTLREKRDRFMQVNFRGTTATLFKRKVEEKRNALQRLGMMLHACNPKNILAKGYIIAFREKGAHVVHSAKELIEGEKVDLQFYDGVVTTEVVKSYDRNSSYI